MSADASANVVAEIEPAAVLPRRARIVDVREASELTGELGRIDGAEHVPLATLGSASAAWDRDAEIVLVCRSGKRSRQGAERLAELGFQNVINMSGGMLAWNASGLPVARR